MTSSTSAEIAVGDRIGSPRPLFHCTEIVVGFSEAFHPGVTRLPTDPELTAQLRKIKHTFPFLPASLPFQYELHSLLHRIRFLPGHFATVRDVLGLQLP